MTIAFMIKPAFSLTKQRNIQRILGTISGGVVGVLIIVFIPSKDIQFVLMVFFMLATYTFTRMNYLIMVIFLTPFVIILFNLLGVSFSEVAVERTLDTAIGCAIAFTASYFLFPTWESGQINNRLQNMLNANAAYLQTITEALAGININMLDYKLVRKEVYVSSANLSAAFQRMLSEPKGKQIDSKLVHQFVVLNHILFSNIATVATSVISKDSRVHPLQLINASKKSLQLIQKTIATLSGEATVPGKIPITIEADPEIENADEHLLKDQLEFIYRLIVDIRKTVESIASR
jgi:uncharacterized membrane protein YccC